MSAEDPSRDYGSKHPTVQGRQSSGWSNSILGTAGINLEMSLDETFSSGEDDTVMVDRQDVSNYNDANILPESPATLEMIRAWLRPTAYNLDSSEQRKHLASHLPGTGNWLASSTTYRQWRDGAVHGMLWIKGAPGSGKSVFAAMLADQLSRAGEGVPVLHFFFRQIIDAHRAPVALLRDWLDQVLIYSPPLQRQLKEHVDNGRSLENLAIDDLWQHLRTALAGLPDGVYCIADALDEMDGGNDNFLQDLADLGKWMPGKVKVLVTSRPVPSIEMPLRTASCLQIRLQENVVDGDIATYIQHSLEHSSISHTYRDLVMKAVMRRANGLFLYAKLAMDGFCEPGANVREVLRLLPADLNTIYTDLLREHARRSTVSDDIQLLILQWVTHSTRPLRLLELAEIINVTHPLGDECDLRARKGLVRAACGPLLEILPDETVCMVHHSLTEYLTDTTRSSPPAAASPYGYPVLEIGPTHARLALACLKYLQSGCLAHWKVKRWLTKNRYDSAPRMNSQMSDLRLQYPFVSYATTNWHIHAHRADSAGFDSSEIHKVLDEFLKTRQIVEAWLDINWPDDAIESFTPLHVAARTGLPKYVQVILKRGDTEVDARDSHGNTPLFWAASNGHATIVQLLLQAGGKPDQDNDDGLKPLHHAASNNHADVVRLLLATGVDPMTPRTRGRNESSAEAFRMTEGNTPLLYACQNGHVDVVDVFLPFLDIPTIHRALTWAASWARARVVERLLRHPGIDVNIKINGDTPLFLACKSGDPGTIGTLLRAGADPNILCENAKYEFEYQFCGLYSGLGSFSKDSSRGYTALHVLHHGPTSCRRSDGLEAAKLQASFSLLLDAGADIHQHDPKGWTPLHHAAGCPTKLRLLVGAGADVNAETDDGATVMQMQRFVEDGAILGLLTKGDKADVNERSKSKGQALLAMLKANKFENALNFLECRPDCNVTDEDGNGPLHYAVRTWRRGNIQLFEALLAGGANPSLKNRGGETPLHLITFPSSNVDLASLLLNAGADIEARDNSGRTWLFCQSSRIDIEHVQKCLDLGARADTRDFKGRTMLHEAVSGGDYNLDKLQYLIDIGVDPTAVDYFGNTLFHEAIQTGNVHWLEKLLELGLDPDQANYAGSTPLHILCSMGLDEPTYINENSPVKYLLSMSKNIDAMDHNGTRPLHLAATISEYLVCELLKSGADPTSATFERLTALHLAVRARQCNIVGILITALADADRSHLMSLVNTKDKVGRTPLHYACRSGRPETVALLLNAGADPTVADELGRTPLQACAEFEVEQDLWDGYRKVTDEEQHELWAFGPEGFVDPLFHACGIKLEDQSRPFVCSGKELSRVLGEMSSIDINTCQDTARLEEILDMLLAHVSKFGKDVSWTAKAIRETIAQAEEAGHDYTASCFKQLQARFQPEATSSFSDSGSFGKLISKYRREVATRAFHESNEMTRGSQNSRIFRRLLRMREYTLVEEMFYKGTDFLSIHNNQTNLHLLAEHGFAVLLEKIGMRESEAKFQKGTWHAARHPQRPGLGLCLKGAGLVDPFLLTACRHELPNMDVVYVLIEKLGVDVNAQSQDTVPRYQGEEVAPGGVSALHALALGRHWWHAAQAIPYLVAHAGADIELRNRCGGTPLHIALGSSCIFQKQAAHALIELGADVNAIDGQGRSCLSLAGKDADLLRLLLARGATLTASALFSAIDGHSVESLEALLSAGIDPNARSHATDEEVLRDRAHEGATGCFPGEFDVDPAEWYPLHYAASARSKAWLLPPRTRADRDRQAALVATLAAHGADPYAVFAQPIRLRRGEDAAHSVLLEEDNPKDNKDRHIEVRDGPLESSPSLFHYAPRSVIHALLEEGSLVQPVLELPTLDLERRDPQGRTLLLAACRSALGADAAIDATLRDTEWDINSGSYVRDPLPSSGGTTLLQFLLARGADPTARDNDGKNALHQLLEAHDSNTSNGRPPLVRASLQHLATRFPALLHQPDHAGAYPLHSALRRLRRYGGRYGHREGAPVEAAVEDLVRAGADPRARDGQGNTALHYLAAGLAEPRGADEQRRLCRLFLDRGAGVDVDVRNERGETPLFALLDDDGGGAEERWPGWRFQARDRGAPSADEVEEMVLEWFDAAGADWHVRDRRGRTLMHVVARHNTARAVERFKYLMKKKVDAMLEDEEQRTALDVAAACENVGVLELFEREVDVQ